MSRKTMMARELSPSPTLPLLYFAGAHASLAIALAVLALAPETAGTFFYHPTVVALVHLVTLGWITGSILGALYIVAPLAFGISLRATRLDAVACASFWAGATGMVTGFWLQRFDVVACASMAVLGAIGFIGVRVIRGLRRSRVPCGVALHVVLAFVNITVAGPVGALLALNHVSPSVSWSALWLAAAHAHLAVLGWATMMIVGVGYRLIPMFVPAAMPRGLGLGASAVLLEIGTIGVSYSLATGRSPIPWLAFVVAALACFLKYVRWMVAHRRPRSVGLPPRDWSTWQAHVAILYLVLAVVLGLWLAAAGGSSSLVWTYGTTALVGFVSQMVLGIGGRLLPMHAWYRAFEERHGEIPLRSVASLIVPSLALTVLACWAVGLPVLMVAAAAGSAVPISAAAVTLLAGVIANATHMVLMMHRARVTHAAPWPYSS